LLRFDGANTIGGMTARILAAFLFVILIAPRLPAEVPPDAEVTKLLVGTWECHDEDIPGFKGGGFTLRADGTYSSYAVMKVLDKEDRVYTEGTWKVEDGVLIQTTTKTNNPEIEKVGNVANDKLLGATEKEFKIKTASGPEFTFSRK
jgi:hypothetical protein